jgi:predicted dithiol-disulfide oxidoreductase (DUF899 family)
MGCRFRWVSSFGSEFNRDYHVSFTNYEMAAGKVSYNCEPLQFPSEEAPGASVFYKNEAGEIFHTYPLMRAGSISWSAHTGLHLLEDISQR